MHRFLLRSLVFLTLLSFVRLASAQTIDTIFGCDDIPTNPLAGAACTICNFDILYGTTFGFTPSPDAGWCGSVENDQYIGFVVGATGSVVFEMTTFNCTNGQGVQVGIYDSNNSLVGNCLGQVMPGVTSTFSASGLMPGTVYYIRIDGFAGDGCEFNIQVVSGLISQGPDAPGPIMGPEEVCWDEAYPYSVAPVPNATGYYWRVTPGIWTAGTTVDPPEATNPLTGTTQPGIEVEIPPMSIAMPPGTCDTILLELFPLNPCFVSNDSSIFNIRVCRPTQDTTYGEICIGGEFEFPPGSGEFFSTPYTFETVQLDPGPNGCDTFGVLYLEQVSGGIGGNVEDVVVCEGTVIDYCGFPDPAIGAGLNSCLLEGASANGCDSTVFFYVTFLDPEAHIEAANGAISCTNLEDTLWAVTRTGSIPPSSSGDTLSYVWTDGSGTVIGNDESVIVTEPGTYTLTVEMTSDLDPTVVCTATTDITIADNRTAPNPPTLNGLTPVCINNVPQDYTASGATGNDQYLWSVLPTTGLTYGVSTDVLTITDFGTLTSATVCVSTYNSCDTSTATCLQLEILPLPTAATLPAVDTLCEGDITSYAIGDYDSDLTYTISSSPTGSSATVNGSNIDFTMGTASGQLCLEVSNTCETLDPVCIDISLRLPPVADAPVGPVEACIGDTVDYTVYSVLPFGTTASVSVVGGTLLSQTGNVATVEWTTAGIGQVCVRLTNICGWDEACLDVDVTTAGDAVLSGGGEYCENDNDLDVTITFTGTGPFDFVYTLGSNVISGSTATSPFVITSPDTGTYTLIEFSVGGCSGTVSGSATVTENPTPEATISGSDEVCIGEEVVLTIDFEGEGPWTYEAALNGAGLGPVTTSDDPTSITVTDPGQYTLLSVESDAGCEGDVFGLAEVENFDTLAVDTPVITCSLDGTTYTVGFSISGGDPTTYQVIPAGSGVLTGTAFLSDTITSGAPYTFTVIDANNCDSVVISGLEECPCLTEIGVLDTTAINICDDGTVTDFSSAYDATNEFLDPTDLRVYTLHTGAGPEIMGPISTNSTGIFGFDPTTMVYGTTYYVSVVVGDDDMAGGVNLAHFCTLVAPGIPVTWYEIPEATLIGGGSVCENSDTTVVVSFTGTGPFTFEYSIGTTVTTETTTSNPYIINLPNLQDDVTITLISVSTDQCDGNVVGSAFIEVNDEVTTVTSFACDSVAVNYVVTIEISDGDPATYTVSPAGSGTLVGSVFTSNPIPSGDPYSFTVTDDNNCGTSIVAGQETCTCITEIGVLTNAPVDICDDGTATDFTVFYDSTDEVLDPNDARVYVLHTGAGTTITGAIATNSTGLFAFDPTTMSYGTTYYISVVVGNDDGAGGVDLNHSCTLVAQGVPATWYVIPGATLVGGGDVCQGADTTVIISFTGVGPFIIQYTVGTTVFNETTTDNPFVINLTNLQDDVTVTLDSVATANCVGQVSGSATIDVHEEVQIVADAVCNSTATEFVVTITISGGDPSSYSVFPNTGTLVGNVFTSDPIAAGAGYSFEVRDQWGCNTEVASEPIVVCNCISDAGTMDGTLISVCGPNDITVVMPLDTAMDSNDAINFVLHDGSGNSLGSVITQQTGTTFSFIPGVTAYRTTYYISSIMGNEVGGIVDLADPCLDVAVGTPVQWLEVPTAELTGGGDFCVGDQIDLVFDVTSAGNVVVVYTDGSSNYTVNLSSGSTTVPAPVGTSAVYSLISITEGLCTGTVSGSASVVVHDSPVVGFPSIEFNSTFTEYRVTFTISLGDTATYTVDGTPLSGATTFTSAWIACGTDYTFVIDDQYGCSPTTISSPVNCDCQTSVGTLSGDLSTCDLTETTGPTYDATNEDLDGDDAVEYILYLTNVTTPILRGSTPVFAFDPAVMTTGTTYYIVAIAGNAQGGTVDFSDPCLQVSDPVTAAWYDLPSVTATAPSAICANEDWIVTIDVSGSPSPKTVYYTFNSVQDSITGVVPGTSGVLTLSVSGNSSIIITGVADSDCGDSANIALDVSVASEIFVNAIDDDNCDATGTEYTVTFEISGGDPSTYVVTPAGSGTITGTTFTSNIIASGTPYDFQVSDASNCFTVSVTGNRRCDCTTDAGQMTSTDMLMVCEGQDISAGFSLGSDILDGNDQLLFALRTSGDRIDYTDDILALNPTPVFPFDPSIMRAGDTLYISPVAGDAQGAMLDTNDPCLSIGFATPVYIEFLPSGQLQGDTIICEGGSADITLVLVGNGPFDVSITEGDSGSDTTLTGVENGYVFQVDPATGTIYVMTNITMSSSPSCSQDLTSRVDIDVDDLLTAGDEMAALVLCEGTGDVIQLSDQLSGEDTGGSWTQANGTSAGVDFNPGSGVVTNNSLQPGSYSFTYTVGSGAPCPQDAAEVDVEIEASPNADAGPDQSISCDLPVVDLGAANVPGYTYSWSGGTVSDSTAAQTTTANTGTFTLTVVSGTAGCEGQDEVVVTSAGDLPEFDNMLIRDVTCFGDTDGAIFTGVEGGTGPYNYSLDGGPTRLSGQFTNITPGVHELTVEDSEGCVYTETFIVEDAKEVIVDPGPNVEIPFGGSHLVELYLEGAIETVSWQGDSLVCLSPGPICDRAMLYPQFSGVYRVTVRDSNGCTASAPLQLIVRRDRPVFIPSAFSPNGDGNNDLVWVRAREGVLQEVSSFQIFDRWGEQVFATGAHQPNDPRFGWDGRLNGEDMNPAVFVYFANVVYADGTKDVIKGDISLVK